MRQTERRKAEEEQCLVFKEMRDSRLKEQYVAGGKMKKNWLRGRENETKLESRIKEGK